MVQFHILKIYIQMIRQIKKDVTIHMGSNNKEEDYTYNIEKVVRHDDNNLQTNHYVDLALVQVQGEIIFSKKMGKIKLPSTDLLVPGKSVVSMAGWGYIVDLASNLLSIFVYLKCF